MDDLSSTSFVSSISASSTYQPKPPGDPKPSSQGFRRSSKAVGKVVRSPYLASSTPFPRKRKKSSEPNGVVRPAPVPVAWTSPPHDVPHPSNVPRPSVSSYLGSLMKTSAFSTNDSRRKSSIYNSRPHPYLTSTAKQPPNKQPPNNTQPPSNSVCGEMDARMLGDELVTLKREMNALRKERDLAKAQQVRLSEELKKKDKHILDLMSTGHISKRDATRSLVKSSNSQNAPGSQGGGSSGGGAALVSSLRQQVHSLERALRGKEVELAGLKEGMAATKLREMQVLTETYYREICRLRHVQEEGENGEGVAITPRQAREAHIKLKALNQATVKMASHIESLEEENRTLKDNSQELHSVLPYNGSYNGSFADVGVGVRGTITDRYQDHNRAQMLAAISELEVKRVELQSMANSALEEKEKEKRVYEQSIRELRGQVTATSSREAILENQVNTLKHKESKFKNVISRLKEDRTHYRRAAEHTQEELQCVQERLGTEEMTREEIYKELQVVREDYQKEMIAIEHSRKISKKPSMAFSAAREKRESAASTIQQNWRRKRAIAKQERYQRENEDAIITIQSALKAHLVRKRVVPSESLSGVDAGVEGEVEREECDEDIDRESTASSEAIEVIQSAVRGYFTRKMALQDLKQEREQDLPSGVGRENSTSSLLRYTPPLTLPEARHIHHSFPSRNKPKRNKAGRLLAIDSTWVRGLSDSGSDEDYQHIHSRSYFNSISSSAESEPHGPDKYLLLDEL